MQLLSGTLSFPVLDDAGSPVNVAMFGMDDFLLTFFALLGMVAVLVQFAPGVLLLVSMARNLFRFTRVTAIPATDRHDA